jgi:hypothetical protein
MQKVPLNRFNYMFSSDMYKFYFGLRIMHYKACDTIVLILSTGKKKKMSLGLLDHKAHNIYLLGSGCVVVCVICCY